MDNPPSPPSAPPVPRLEPQGTTSGQRPPASAPAGKGIEWWSRGWHIFAASPVIWIVITILFVVILIMLSFIPIIGPIAATVLSPVLAGGVMLGCRTIDRGGTLTIAHLFMSFADRLMPLIVVGLLYFVISLVIVFAMFVVMVAAIGLSGVQGLLSGDPFAFVATFGIGTLMALCIGMVLWLPLLMAYWFAPPLVVFHNEEPWRAMKSSFGACVVNVVPMLLYGVLGLVFSILASIPFGLGWLVLLPVFAGSVYASYKDIYGDTG